MQWVRVLSTSITLLVIGLTSAFAEILPTGEDTNSNNSITPSVIQLGSCNVLWYGVSSGDVEIPRLRGLGLTITQTLAPADLSAVNLANYDVLVIAYTGAGSIGANQPAIAAFVAANNGLLIHQPNFVGTIDYAPAGLDVTESSNVWCGSGDAVIVNGAHPVTSGLADADLSGDFDTVSGLGGGYTVLGVNATCLGNPALAAGTFGSGRVVLETGNANPNALDPGSDLYWARVFEWLCAGTTTNTEQPTWGRLKVLYR